MTIIHFGRLSLFKVFLQSQRITITQQLFDVHDFYFVGYHLTLTDIFHADALYVVIKWSSSSGISINFYFVLFLFFRITVLGKLEEIAQTIYQTLAWKSDSCLWSKGQPWIDQVKSSDSPSCWSSKFFSRLYHMITTL